MGAGTVDEARTVHDLPAEEAWLLLGSDPRQGLRGDEARDRLARHGPNRLPRAVSAGPVRRLLRQLHHPLVYVLVVSGFVTLALRELVDSAVIFGVVVLNAVIGFVQESKADAALEALRSMVHTRARVVRDGLRHEVASEELVPGDLVLLEAGDKVPADLRLVDSSELRLDESALTGESLPVPKRPGVVERRTPVADRSNMAWSGTLVVAGTGSGVVVATGAGTEVGEIHRLVGGAEVLATPLSRKLAVFSAWLTGVVLALAVLTFAVGVARGEAGAEMFTAAVALAVGAIPEGLPAAVTITLAIGVSRMARRGAVVRRLPAVETLGGATVICSDKTGTLTQNRMSVRLLWSPSSEVEVGDRPEPGTLAAVRDDQALWWCLLAGANCNDAALTEAGQGVGDPTETAMLLVARHLGAAPHALPRLGSVPFSSERQYMATRHADGGRPGSDVVLVKGGVERVLALCSQQLGPDGAPAPLAAEPVLAAAHALAAQGMRVLATALLDDAGPDALEDVVAGRRPLVLTGLQAMLDPPRDTAAAAVRSCREAGIEVKMITGDHAGTAVSVARQVGLLDGDGDGDAVLSGAEVEALDDGLVGEAVERASVFARVSPGQKLRIVEALQARRHVVAMTGDGVNDAPALKRADVGVAMGRSGTEVAKDAGDVVLTDDDFATIEAAVEEGRGVFDNITKFIVWTLPTNMGEGLVILVAILLGTSLPILPTQILWINMTTAVALGLMLAFEPKEDGIMTRPPRDPRRSLLSAPVVLRTLLVSALLVVGSRWVFDHELAQGASLEVSRTAAINVFVTVEAFYLFSCRSLVRPLWRSGLLGNRWLLVGVAVQVVLQAALTYLPAMNALFHTAPIDAGVWLRIVLVAVAATVVVELDKLRWRRSAATARP
ncbi:MAG: HAD-IC family P-type ATPase [Nocardioides marinisabuli]|uniref:HAD-IC family P-type ATPase n=1 Tax=Nocardioides marinisabuli TaxID=419476 RepID=UPI00321A9BB2